MIPPGQRICGLAIAGLCLRRNDEGLQSACIWARLVKLFTSAPEQTAAPLSRALLAGEPLDA